MRTQPYFKAEKDYPIHFQLLLGDELRMLALHQVSKKQWLGFCLRHSSDAQYEQRRDWALVTFEGSLRRPKIACITWIELEFDEGETTDAFEHFALADWPELEYVDAKSEPGEYRREHQNYGDDT